MSVPLTAVVPFFVVGAPQSAMQMAEALTLTAEAISVVAGHTETGTLTAAGGAGGYTYSIVGAPTVPDWLTVPDPSVSSYQAAPGADVSPGAYLNIARVTDADGNTHDVTLTVTVTT